jgi:hypothetical protein
VALDDQAGKLHLPFLERMDRRSPSVRVAAGELIVRRVEEFLIEGATRTRWFELDGIVYEPATRRVSIGSDGRSQFALTVEALDITLRIRPQTRPSQGRDQAPFDRDVGSGDVAGAATGRQEHEIGDLFGL